MKLCKIALMGALVTVTALSFAQGPGGQGPGGQGRGGWGRGGMMRGMGGVMLLNRADVSEELALTDDQKSKLAELREKTQDEMRNAMGEAQGDREAMQKIMQKLFQNAEAETNKILTPEQVKRLKELSIQRAGNRAVMQPEVQKDLGLSDAQKASLTELTRKMGEANRSVMEKVRSGEIEREAVREIMEKNGKALDGEIAKILTPAQSAKLSAMGGKPFAFRDEE